MIGTGILKGMAVTGRNFLGSYFEKDRLTTVQYPEERILLPENSRNFPFLIFDIDISVCMSCQICVEVCPFEAIKMDKVYELSRRERFEALLLKKSDLAKSNDYYHRIHPLEAETVDAALAAAAAAKRKPAPAAASPPPG